MKVVLEQKPCRYLALGALCALSACASREVRTETFGAVVLEVHLRTLPWWDVPTEGPSVVVEGATLRSPLGALPQRWEPIVADTSPIFSQRSAARPLLINLMDDHLVLVLDRATGAARRCRRCQCETTETVFGPAIRGSWKAFGPDALAVAVPSAARATHLCLVSFSEDGTYQTTRASLPPPERSEIHEVSFSSNGTPALIACNVNEQDDCSLIVLRPDQPFAMVASAHEHRFSNLTIAWRGDQPEFALSQCEWLDACWRTPALRTAERAPFPIGHRRDHAPPN
jgi:hypothetical protein